MNKMVVCTKCKESKKEEEFRKRKGVKNGLNSWCRECQNLDNKKRYSPKPKKPKKEINQEEVKRNAKIRMLKHRYDLTIDEYEQMYESQNKKCAICDKEYKLGGMGGLYVDHCHETNKVRGLLCNSCNSSLGKFGDNIEMLQRAIDYLSRY